MPVFDIFISHPTTRESTRHRVFGITDLLRVFSENALRVTVDRHFDAVQRWAESAEVGDTIFLARRFRTSHRFSIYRVSESETALDNW